MIRLSIIIPVYNKEPYIHELLDNLAPQITDEVEVILIDDGSRNPLKSKYKWAKITRQPNQGCSSARNRGIDKAKGEYISFIDADDLVSGDFVRKILKKTESAEYDILEFSWRSLNNNNWCCDQRLTCDTDRLPNPSVCTRVFNRKFVGDIRFNVKKDTTEDEDFSRRIGYLDNERSKDIRVGIITDYLYFYRDDVPYSKTKKHAAGLMNCKRIVYYYDHVTEDMTDVLESIKKDDEEHEVYLMTHQCDIPEIRRWCRVITPKRFWGHILKGEKTDLLELRKPPYKTQVILYRYEINSLGGLNTFTKHFIDELKDYYDITVVCRTIAETKYKELSPKVRVIATTIKKQDGTLVPAGGGGDSQPMMCDTLILLSILTPMPGNIHAGQVIRMVHTCKTDPSWEIPKDYDRLIFVSETSMRSFGEDKAEVIHNLIKPPKNRALLLVSATRFPAPDKGKIEIRMRKLANMLNEKGIDYIWLNFASGSISFPPKNFYNMGISDRIPEIIKAADYLVQLSDSECWSYACLEALTAGTPLICTPFPSIYEMGVKDNVNAKIIPFDMDYDVTKLLDIPSFEYTYDNEGIVARWRQLLGDTKPKGDYEPDKMVLVEVLRDFHDIELDQLKTRGTAYQMRELRAQQIMATNPELIRIVEG